MSDLCFGFVSSFAFISLREREREGGGRLSSISVLVV